MDKRLSYKVLVVEDDTDILDLLDYNLANAGFTVIKARDGYNALDIARDKKPDIILLDLMLPELDGVEVCKILKNEGSTRQIPVLMVTAKGEEIDRVVGLEVGADDYIVKPFSPRELVLRVKAVLKRIKRDEPAKVRRHGPLFINFETHEVTVDDLNVILTTTEFKILRELLQSPGSLFSRDLLIDRVWGVGCYVTSRTVDTHIRRLRKKLNRAKDLIETVRGFGYKMRGIP
jgi:two-component system phosphate regulon response regulator PhoB